ncbi:hypothetical protein FA95DRAFT_1495443, partial [Auriscalpium vulgare]
MEQTTKPDAPFTYDGTPDFKKFQKWTFESKDFIGFSFIRRKHQVRRLKKYLDGRALAFYMRDVAKKPEKWTLRRFFEALFDHCFPANFRTIQREKYMAFAQKGHPVRNFRHDLEDLADSIGHISKRDFVIRFWNGADRYLRVKWAENGFDPEISTIEQLERAAERYERAY